jgi:hypothetical protein
MRRRTDPKWLLLGSVAVLGLVAALAFSATARQSRLSGAVAFAPDTPATAAFLARPGVGYVQAHVRFGPDLADDVIIFLDQELLEGLAQPRWIKGGDWMAFVGVQRAGGVWVGGGSEASLRGEPSRDRKWRIHDLKRRLEPDTWYRLRIVADFATRHFVSFSIQGGGLDATIDLAGVPLDYPNYMPFDAAGMIYIVGAMRGRSMMRREGVPLVYFDDIEGGIVHPDGRTERLFQDDFESQADVGPQPLTTPTVRLSNYTRGRWYLERAESVFRIETAPFARTGKRVGVADANLRE